jgi:DNA-binding winged helix-turn-helix (wHTH) protein/TolB-like protein/Tfp pilus assembly protein PilF
MSSNYNGLREFGKFRLDVSKRVLWFEDRPVNLPLKEIELLCVLTENGGEVITKEELLDRVWSNTFVIEGNLPRHIHSLRKTFKAYGESDDLIQTVPRRGYRFAGDIRETGIDHLIIEKHSLTRTLIEKIEDSNPPNFHGSLRYISGATVRSFRIPILVGVIILGIALGSYFYRQSAQKAISSQSIKSIAVLPVKSFSATTENDKELRLRITDAIITNLGALRQISVRPTSSVLPFAETSENPLDMGRKLEVDAILEGRMQAEGNRLRVTFQLIAVKDGEQIWSGQFDGEANNILNLQDTISQEFVTQLNRRNLFENQPILEKNPTENAEAYENYLQGRYFFNQRGISYGASLNKARPYFERAIELDPNFAAAVAGLADVVNLQTDNSSSSFKNLHEGYIKGRELALKALELDRSLAEAYTALGWIQQRYDWNYEEAERSFKKAIALRPNSTNAYLWLSINYSLQGRADDALEYAKKATEIEPTLSIALENLALMYARRGDCQEAVEILPRLAEYQIVLFRRNTFQGEILSICGRCSEAIGPLEEAIADEERKGNKSPRINSTLGYCYAVTNQTEKARKVLRVLQRQKENGYAMYGQMLIYANLGETETALRILNEFYQTRDARFQRLKVDSRLNAIQPEPRFREIMRKMNLLN